MKVKSTKKPVEKTTVVVEKKKCGRPKKPGTEITFTVHADKGKSVYVAGDFNGWDPTAKKLAFRNGVYSAKIKLLPGDHEYKFVIDGTWCADPENAQCVPNDQGTFNSVITVK